MESWEEFLDTHSFKYGDLVQDEAKVCLKDIRVWALKRIQYLNDKIKTDKSLVMWQIDGMEAQINLLKELAGQEDKATLSEK